MDLIIISVFVLGYFLITVEHYIKIDKLIPALAMMAVMWAIVALNHLPVFDINTELLELVPTGSDLIVETKINPKDIAEIAIGQEVKISLTAYDPSKYGRLDGKVMSISADAISDNQTGEQFYQVDVSIDSTLYEQDGKEVQVLPGMVASIDVLSGKRTVLDYFWQPIARTKNKALRD